MINVIIDPENPQTFDLSVGTEVLLSFGASAGKPVHGVVSEDSDRACSHCLLEKTEKCYEFFRCHPDDREDRDSVYLAPRGGSHVAD
jgi:hypothetical protein